MRYMPRETALGAEAKRADRALERLLPRVRSHVGDEIALLVGTVGAVVAVVRGYLPPVLLIPSHFQPWRPHLSQARRTLLNEGETSKEVTTLQDL